MIYIKKEQKSVSIKQIKRPGSVARAFNPSMGKPEAGRPQLIRGQDSQNYVGRLGLKTIQQKQIRKLQQA